MTSQVDKVGVNEVKVISVTLLALLSVGLRLISRRLKHQRLWWDDCMAMFSNGIAWYMVCVGFIFAMDGHGMGIYADLVHSKNVVIFTYSNLDLAYTLASMVEWMAIEMSARIFSANLPTLSDEVVTVSEEFGVEPTHGVRPRDASDTEYLEDIQGH
ncbi:unnamed protein product, partial [Clonostachys rosea]